MNHSSVYSRTLRAVALMAAVCGLNQTAAAQTNRTVNDTWVESSWATANSSTVSVFPDAAYYDFTGINVPEANGGSDVVATFLYSGGSHRQDTYGLEVIDASGNIVGHDYHVGFTGGSQNNNVYTVSGVAAGTYTMRCWTGGRANNEDNNSNGNLTLAVGGTQSGAVSWNNQTWTVDPSKVTAQGLIDVYAGKKIGQACYKYMDKRFKVGDDATITLTYAYEAGAERVDLLGVEAIDANGNVVASDGHFGFTGVSHSDNTYTLKVAASGLYTIRTWSNYVRPLTGTRGNITASITETVAFVDHQPFTIKNPSNAEGGDGRGTLAYWSGNTVTDAPIAVGIKDGYNNFLRPGWPTTPDADGVYTTWAMVTGASGKTYVYNVETGRFLSSKSISYINENREGVALSDVPVAIDINKVSGGYQLVCAGGNNNKLCFGPYWGQGVGYYAIWFNDNADANLCNIALAEGAEVSADIRAVVEKEVELAEALESAGSYVGQYDAQAIADAQNLLSSNGGTRDAATAAGIKIQPSTISTDKYYRIENCVNPSIALRLDPATGKFAYGSYAEGDNSYIFRFVAAGTETSSNWSGSKEYETYKIYCVGADKEGYIGWGTYNTQVVAENNGEAIAYKVVNSGGIKHQLSGHNNNDNCTLSIGNGQTTLADNASGAIVSWNIFNNTALTNNWQLSVVDEPEAHEVAAVAIPAGGATARYFHRDAVIPAGVSAKILVGSEAAPYEATNSYYNLKFKNVEGNIIPAGTAAVVESTDGTSGNYSFKSTMEPSEYVASSVPTAENALFGHHEETAVAADAANLYGISASGEGEDEEHAFIPFSGTHHQPGEAYLGATHLGDSFIAVPGFNLTSKYPTGIGEISDEAQAADKTAYDLFGRRAVKPSKGVYIIGGKKVLVK